MVFDFWKIMTMINMHLLLHLSVLYTKASKSLKLRQYVWAFDLVYLYHLCLLLSPFTIERKSLIYENSRHVRFSKCSKKYHISSWSPMNATLFQFDILMTIISKPSRIIQAVTFLSRSFNFLYELAPTTHVRKCKSVLYW